MIDHRVLGLKKRPSRPVVFFAVGAGEGGGVGAFNSTGATGEGVVGDPLGDDGAVGHLGAAAALESVFAVAGFGAGVSPQIFPAKVAFTRHAVRRDDAGARGVAATLARQADADEAQALLEAGDAEAALAKLADALASDPGNDDARFDYIRLLIELGGLEEAEAALAPKLTEIPRKLRFEALLNWLIALKHVASGSLMGTPIARLDEAIAANKRNFDARYAKACLLIALREWTAAMDELLEIILRDKKWNDELPRKTVVAILELLTPAKPKPAAQAPGKTAGGIEVLGQGTVQEDPQAALVSSYRRRLAMMLN